MISRGRFSIRTDHAGTDTVAVIVTGEIDMSTAPEFEEQLSKAVEQHGPAALLVDLADVSFIDSTGLNALVRAFERQQRRGAGLALVSVDSRVAMMLEVSRLDEILKRYPTREAALEALRRNPTRG